MEIEFNASQFPPVRTGGSTAAARSASAAMNEASAAGNLEELKAKLAQFPLERAHVISRVMSALEGSQYPPDDVLDRIAVLLANHFNP
jgi:hypothetical protein